MKYILKIVLILFAIAVYSCNTASKKQLVDSVIKPNLQAVDTLSKKAKSVEEKSIYTNLIFPKFKIKLHGFGLFNTHGIDEITDSTTVAFNVNKDKNWNVTAKTDTIALQAYDFDYLIELIPSDKNDRFKVSYSYNVNLDEHHVKGIHESVIPDYKPLKDSLNYFFKVPASASDNHDMDEFRKKADEVKKKLNIKDTVIKYKNPNVTDFPSLVVSYKNKVFDIDPGNNIYVKIERFNANKLIDTKFLVMNFVDGEIAD